MDLRLVWGGIGRDALSEASDWVDAWLALLRVGTCADRETDCWNCLRFEVLWESTQPDVSSFWNC